DFLRCNKYYEDIPIYKEEYKEFISNLKKFLLIYYGNLINSDEETNIMRLKNFFIEFIKIVENENPSYNIFINHNAAIRTFVKFMLSEEEYKRIKNSEEISDEDFFLLCPKFGGKYSLIIRENNSLIFEADGQNVTNKV